MGTAVVGGITGGNRGLQASVALAGVPICPAVVLNCLSGAAGLITLVTGFCGAAVASQAVFPVAYGQSTGTVTVQVPGALAVPAGICPPVIATLVPPMGAFSVPPVQLVVAAPPTVKGAGSRSVTRAPPTGTVRGFDSVIVSVLVPPRGTVAGPNAF